MDTATMEIVMLTRATAPLSPCVATIGMFDGVHRGHQYVLQRLVEQARQRSLPACVVTFNRHPRQVVQPDWHPQLLCSLSERLQLLSACGVNRCVVLDFDVSMAALSACDFMQQVLCGQLSVRCLLLGYDNRFGHNRSEGFEDYCRYGRAMGIEVVKNDSWSLQGERVSSSVVRGQLQEGRVEAAAQSLGYPYTVAGSVVGGEHIGTTLGFPTANVELSEPLQMVPCAGVYAVQVRLEQETEWRNAMMNIGTRPTFGGRRQTLEVHILHYHADLYGRLLEVRFMHRLRDERLFADAEALRQQLQCDAALAEQQLKTI